MGDRRARTRFPFEATALAVKTVFTLNLLKRPWEWAGTEQEWPRRAYGPRSATIGGETLLLGPTIEAITEADARPLRLLALALGDSYLRARMCDVLWERFHQPEDAHNAMAQYEAFARAHDGGAGWSDAKVALGRASVLAVLLKKRDAFVPLLDLYRDAANRTLATEYGAIVLPRYGRALFNTLLHSKQWRRDLPHEHTEFWITTLRNLSERLFGSAIPDGDPAFEVLLDFLHASGVDKVAVQATRKRRIEHLLKCTEHVPPMNTSLYAEKATKLAMAYGIPELGQIAQNLARQCAKQAEAAMAEVPFSFQLDPSHVELLRSHVAAAETPNEAFARVACIPHLLEMSPLDLARQATERMRQAPLMALIPTVHYRDGKVSHRASEPEDKLRETKGSVLGLHAVYAASLLWVAWSDVQQRWPGASPIGLALEAPWLSKKRLGWLRRAWDAHKRDDYASASLILSTLYESVARDLLRAAGHAAARIQGDTTLDDTLGTLLAEPRLQRALGEGHLIVVRHVLCDPELGFNLRNELAHGNADAESISVQQVSGSRSRVATG